MFFTKAATATERTVMEKTRYEGIKSLIRLTPVGFAAVSVYAVLVFFLFARRFDDALTVAAFCGIFVTALTGIFTASGDIRQGIPDTRFLRARYAALNFALSLFTLLFLWQLTRYAQGERLIFAGIIMFAYMTSGGLALCSCPPMQIAWLLPLSAGMAAMILRYAGGIALPLLLTLIFYIAVIVLFSCYFTRMLYLRFAAAAKVERQSELTRMLLDDFEKRARDWMLEVDSEGRVSHVSSRFAEMPGCTADKLTGRQFYEIMSGIVVPGEGEPYEEMYQRFRRERTPFQDEVLEVLINGERHWWMISGQPTFTEAGEYTGWRFIGRDITEQKLHEARMEWQATHDMQTGLFNRYHFLHIVENALKHTEDSALMRIDFINYRAIVTIRGQMAGDAVIREFGGRLKRFAGERVAATRTGTSGFALLLREDSSPALQNLIRGYGRHRQRGGAHPVAASEKGYDTARRFYTAGRTERQDRRHRGMGDPAGMRRRRRVGAALEGIGQHFRGAAQTRKPGGNNPRGAPILRPARVSAEY